MSLHFLFFPALVTDAWRFKLVLDPGRRIIKLVGVGVYFYPSFFVWLPDMDIVALFGDAFDSSEHEEVARLCVKD